MLKKIISIVCASCMCFCLFGCSDIYDDIEVDYEAHHFDPNQTWSIYWYLCGSDLESDGGAATLDLEEMMNVDLPENVQVVIETGGASAWDNDVIDADHIQRYVYNSDGLSLVDETSQKNMGDPKTLTSFLKFCKKNYPADRTMALIWNHGGSSLNGAAFDENYMDQLELEEFYQGFNKAFPASKKNPPIDLIGFDACMMADIDTAGVFSNFAKYMVASEELEPGCGWEYEGWLQSLSDDPGMDGLLLGKAICDSYLEGCEMYDVDAEATLSVVDLQKIDPLIKAYDDLGYEALSQSLEDSEFLTEISRNANYTENFGGYGEERGVGEMMDLGDFTDNCDLILSDSSEKVQDALNDCIAYRVSGPYRQFSSGLSCYFPYNGDLETLNSFVENSHSDSFKYLYEYLLTGSLENQGVEYLQDELDYEEDIPEVDVFENEEEYPITLDEDGCMTLQLDPEVVSMVDQICFELMYVEDDFECVLGWDNDIECDWDNGVFKDNFRNVWGTIDGHLVCMDVMEETDEYTLYAVPILLNDEEYYLDVVYKYDDEKFEILGAGKCPGENGEMNRNLEQLEVGDEITTLHYIYDEDEEDYVQYPIETFKVKKNTKFEESDLGDGTFVLHFILEDVQGNYLHSQAAMLTMENGEGEIEIIE